MSTRLPGKTKPPSPSVEPQGSCDWGGCDSEATTWRYDETSGWLPVCGKCLNTHWDTTQSDGRPRRTQ